MKIHDILIQGLTPCDFNTDFKHPFNYYKFVPLYLSVGGGVSGVSSGSVSGVVRGDIALGGDLLGVILKKAARSGLLGVGGGLLGGESLRTSTRLRLEQASPSG